MVKIAIVGSRSFNDYDYFELEFEKFLKENNIKNYLIVSGGAAGADTLAEIYAKKNNIEIKIFKPDWKTYGKSAGYIRNKTIWDNSDIGIAFWDGESKGTKHSFEIAEKQNKLVKIVNYNIKEMEIW